MIQQHNLRLRPYPQGFHLITRELLTQVGELPRQGIFHLFIQHTSAGLSLNENADPSVRHDFAAIFDRLIPEDQPYYTHTLEGSDDMPAHVKSSLVGASVSIPISDHRLQLGTWQGIYLCEFRKQGGSRKLVLTLYS
jgi:secondary thiamine-phosphate synthase enzyme